MEVYDRTNWSHLEKHQILLDHLFGPGPTVSAGSPVRRLPDEIIEGGGDGDISLFELPGRESWPRLHRYHNNALTEVLPALDSRLFVGYWGEKRDADHVFFVLLTGERIVFLVKTMALIESALRELSARGRNFPPL